MYLQRVRVPDFRVLKDVDITFEKEFNPSIFPIGSQNGGGKSTLLQLVFSLLHCCVNTDRIPFLKKIITDFRVYQDTQKRVLAVIDIWYKNQTVQLEFFAAKKNYIQQLLYLEDSTNEQDKDLFVTLKTISLLRQEENRLSKNQERLEFLLRSKKSENLIHIEENLEKLKVEIAENDFKNEQLKRILKKIIEYLKFQNIIYISTYSSQEDQDEEEALFCMISNLETTEPELFLQELANKVFLAAPSTQVFLFLSQKAIKLLFKEDKRSSNDTYYSHIKTAKSNLPGLFLYDFLFVDMLVDYFKTARDKDFQEVIKTGKYGENYNSLLNDLNYLLGNKQLNLMTDLSGVTFKIHKDEEVVELAPEDLSHGELKRLSIYMWLKYRNIENAIVLMDEIEIAFHPDWQYQIVSDLNQWEPSNQYILATHSYELCQALTPAHVKELEPRLMKQSSGQV